MPTKPRASQRPPQQVQPTNASPVVVHAAVQRPQVPAARPQLPPQQQQPQQPPQQQQPQPPPQQRQQRPQLQQQQSLPPPQQQQPQPPLQQRQQQQPQLQQPLPPQQRQQQQQPQLPPQQQQPQLPPQQRQQPLPAQRQQQQQPQLPPQQRQPTQAPAQAVNASKGPPQVALELKGAPLKPPGTRGRKVELLANYFPLEVKQQNFYRYLVEFFPPIAPEDIPLRKSKMEARSRTLREIFGPVNHFDGTNLLATKDVRNVPSLEDSEGGRIDIEYKATVPTNDASKQEVQAIYNALMKIHLRELKLIQFGRSYYYRKPDAIGQTGLQMFKGFTLTVTPCVDGMMACVDLAHRVCSLTSMRSMMNAIEANVRKDMADKTEDEKRQAIMRSQASKFNGCVVISIYNRRIWKIDHIDYSKTINSSFTKKDGKTTTFKDYYAEQYDMRVQEVRPGLLVNLKKEKGQFNPDGSQKMKETILIPEFCYLTGVTDELKENTQVMKLLADYTRKSPNDRFQAIQNLIREVTKTAGELKDTLTLSLEAKRMFCRVFEPFDIEFRNGPLTIKGGKGFAAQNREAGFLGKTIPRLHEWTIVCEKRDERTANEVGRKIIQLSRQQGGDVGQFGLTIVPDTRKGPQRAPQWSAVMQKVFGSKPKLVLFLVPQGDPSLYSFVKYQTAVAQGVVSQALIPETALNQMNPVCGNLFKQMMSKLGYTQWKVDFKKQVLNPLYQKAATNTMFVGIDVCHDSKVQGVYASATYPNETGSVVGFCATYDEDYAQCHSLIARQGKNEEFVRDSCNLMAKQMQAYKAKRKVYPENIVVFRDGVGDSQMSSFVNREILEYNKAFTQLGIAPKLTVVVVRKRGNTRFFQECEVYAGRSKICHRDQRCDGRGQYHSAPAGSVIDTVVVSPNWFNYFINCCDPPPKATSRPTHFLVVRDDMGWSSDDLQTLSHQLCYTYPNWQGPIRVPSMVMFAHKICYLFCKYVNGTPSQLISDKLFFL